MMNLPASGRQKYIRGAAILGITMVIVKIVSFIYKLPIQNLLGDAGTAHFQVTYQIYSVLLAVSTTGIPVALSRLISVSASTGHPKQAKRYFSVALLAFTALGLFFSLIMFCFAPQLAILVKDVGASNGIRAIAPAVLLVCIVSVFEGYGQAYNDLFPTTAKQISEVFCKLIIGFAAVWWLLSMDYDTPLISAGALIGAPVGLFIALIILIIHKRKADKAESANTISYSHDKLEGRKKTLANILRISIPITLGSSFMSILTLVDTVVVRDRLNIAAGYPLITVDVLYGVYSKGLTLLVLPSAFIVPITVTIIPIIAAALANHRHRNAARITERSLKLTNILSMPAGLGLCILSYPIFNVLYWGSNENGPACLTVFGIASYFVCMQLITTALLQAYGYARCTIVSYLIGGAAQIIVDYILVGNPDIGIIGSPLGTLTCYLLITIINFIFIAVKTKFKPRLGIFIKPAICSGIMVLAARSVYSLLYKAGSGSIGTGRFALALFLIGAVIIAVIVYVILVVASKTVTREDMRLLPKGEKLADILRMK